MATFQHISEGAGAVWHNLVDGWRNLSRRASRAMTRFTLGRDTVSGGSQEMNERSAGWGVLACEVFDNDKDIIVRLEAPGMEKDDFDLQVINNYLLVRGEKQMTNERTEGGCHISECAYGSFERAIPLHDEVEIKKAKASYKQGVLRVELPKSRPAKHIKIKLH